MAELQEQPEVLNMDEVKISPEWALAIPGNLAIRKQVLPFVEQDQQVYVACANPQDEQALQAVERYLHRPLVALAAEPKSLERTIQRIFQDIPGRNGNSPVPLRTQLTATGSATESDSENAVALSDEIFRAALIRSATDIHIEPGANGIRVRLRVDGVLENYREIPGSMQSTLISRLKVLCGMDIAERRAPQDGRYTLPLDKNREIDIRAASIPTKHGERMTLRLLAMNDHPFELNELGMSEHDRDRFVQAIHRPHGLILVTGPTGCGKSTTLYAAIREMTRRKMLNVLTIEDPVESLINGISQIEVDANDKVSFHKALRSVLRHDPDVLMIGEIRDEETAETAIKAALTGHLVLSTLHANSAVGSISRLVDMKVRPFLAGAVLQTSVAQRLVRKICPRCRIEAPITDEQARLLGRKNLTGTMAWRAGGCRYCAGTGFVGRVGLFEFVFFDAELAQVVGDRATELQIAELLRERGNPTLLDDAIEKLQQGITTFEEIVSVISPG
jgi:type II secretory ATPase GspE/PulE/Tfp pilus assembly ATPase PilB-like protein